MLHFTSFPVHYSPSSCHLLLHKLDLLTAFLNKYVKTNVHVPCNMGIVHWCLVHNTYRFVWHLFTVFTFIHLYANYQAVLSLKLVTLNNARLILLLRTYLRMEMALSPQVVNKEEAVILGTGLSGNYSKLFNWKVWTSWNLEWMC